MKITHNLTYTGPLARVLDILTSEELMTRRAAAVGLTDYSFSGAANTWTVSVPVPTDQLPAIAHKFIPASLRLDIIATVSSRDGGAAIDFAITPSATLPGKASARLTLTDAGETTPGTMAADVSVSIPFVGGRIEKEVATKLPELLARDTALVNSLVSPAVGPS